MNVCLDLFSTFAGLMYLTSVKIFFLSQLQFFLKGTLLITYFCYLEIHTILEKTVLVSSTLNCSVNRF